ncbi:hypothetical protein HGRIS_012581 [Hohenbuehelia grisea]|uniref:Beta-lactamase-related domain-containing protein n=1 Tax=Hohenbuehelia grisea TaxID=104357 RepID=A0ABR3ISW2_9AGAR
MHAFHLFGTALVGLSQFVFHSHPATPFESKILTPDLDDYIAGILKEWNSVAGAGVAVVRLKDDGEWQIETKGYGNARLDGTKVTEETLFAIASNSKLFTALAVGQLIANESLSPRISWDTKIQEFIPEFDMMDPTASAATSIVDAMSHRTGLPRHDLMYRLHNVPLDVQLKYLKPSLELRESFQYNNLMYTLLSYIPTALLPARPTIADISINSSVTRHTGFWKVPKISQKVTN